MAAEKALLKRAESRAGPRAQGHVQVQLIFSLMTEEPSTSVAPVPEEYVPPAGARCRDVTFLPTYARQCSGANSQPSFRDAVAQTTSIWHG